MVNLEYSLDKREPNVLQMWLHFNPEGWQVFGGGWLGMPQAGIWAELGNKNHLLAMKQILYDMGLQTVARWPI